MQWSLGENATELDIVKECLKNSLAVDAEDELMKYAMFRHDNSIVDDDFVSRADVWDCVDRADMMEIEQHTESIKKKQRYPLRRPQ